MATTLSFDASSDPILQRRRRSRGWPPPRSSDARSTRRSRSASAGSFLGIAIVPLVGVVVYVVIKGLPAWNADFFTHVTTPEGIPGGGVWNAIVGTAEIGIIATAVAVPLGLLVRSLPGRVGREGLPAPSGSPPT